MFVPGDSAVTRDQTSSLYFEVTIHPSTHHPKRVSRIARNLLLYGLYTHMYRWKKNSTNM